MSLSTPIIVFWFLLTTDCWFFVRSAVVIGPMCNLSFMRQKFAFGNGSGFPHYSVNASLHLTEGYPSVVEVMRNDAQDKANIYA